MKQTKFFIVAAPLAIALGVLFAFIESSAHAQVPPSTIACTASTVTPTAGGVATGVVPDAGTAEGISAENVRSYVVYACPPVGQTITAAGQFDNYHCHAATGKCGIVQSNKQSITTATATPGTVSAGQGTGAPACWESGPFTVPYFDSTSDRIVWVPNGITVATTDGGVLTTYVCPSK